MVGQQTLDLYVRVRFFPPQLTKPAVKAGFLFFIVRLNFKN